MLPERIGEWQILGLLGRGGMGVVYRAQRGNDPPAALKVLPLLHLASETHLSRFRREAEVLRRLDHPGIARYLDDGVLETGLGLQPWLAMELVDGVTLGEHLRRTQPDRPTRLGLLAALCDAVDAAHRAGVVHRDLKPENILVTPAGIPRVLDFGIARRLAEEAGATTLTRTDMLMGTVAYMSPEQALGTSGGVDARSDVYSLGVIGYEMLAGRLPYEVPEGALHRALLNVMTREPDPLGRGDPSLRGPLEHVFGHALRKRPAERYATAAAFADDLRRAQGGRPVQARGATATARLGRFTRRHPRWATAAITLLITGALAGAGLAVPALRERLTGPDTETVYRSIILELDEAGSQIHRATRTTEDLRTGIARLEDLRRQILRADRREYTDDLLRMASFRLGEAYYFLGVETWDADALGSASRAWKAASEIHRPYLLHPALPDTTLPIYQWMVQLTDANSLSALAAVHEEWAFYGNTVGNTRTAIASLLGAIDSHMRMLGVPSGPDGRPVGLTRWEVNSPAREGAAIYFNDLGGSRAALGECLDSLALVDLGLEDLAYSRGLGSLDHIPAALASLHHHLGMAWRIRAELSGDPAALDSADAWLARALEHRTAQNARDPFFDTIAEVAAVHRVRARLSTDPARKRRERERAVAVMEDALGRVAASAAPQRRALVEWALASALLDRAEGDRHASLARAESLLDDAAGYFTMDRARAAAPRLAAERLRLECLRAERGDASALARGRRYQETAGLYEPLDDLRRHRRIVVEESRRLEAAGQRAEGGRPGRS